jgi:16S rRNA processing protein RimM
LVLGLVVGAHGLRGELRVRWLGDGPENLAGMPAVELASGLDDPEPRHFTVSRVRDGRRGEVRVILEGIGDRDAAEGLRGLQVIGEAGHLEPLEPGEYRWYELVGCRVFRAHPETGSPAELIGEVREIWETGAHDVLVVEDEEGQRHLLPAAQAFLREIDPAGRRIVYEVIPGLLDDPL